MTTNLELLSSAALYSHQTPSPNKVVLATRVTPIVPLRRTSINEWMQKNTAETVYELHKRGFTSRHMRIARYPSAMVNLMTAYETINPQSYVNTLALVPIERIFYNTKMPPVVCPKCQGHFVLRSNGEMRKHICTLPASATIRKTRRR